MEQQRLTYLLEQYLAHTASTAEQEELSVLLKADTDRELFTTVLGTMMPQETPVHPANPAVWQKMVQDIVSIEQIVR